jgi:flagellin
VNVDFGDLVSSHSAIVDSSGQLVHNTANNGFKDVIVAAADTATAGTHTVGITGVASLKAGDTLMFTVREFGGVTTHDVAITLNAADITALTTTGTGGITGTTVIEDGKTLTNIIGTTTNTAGSIDMGFASIAGTSTIGEIKFTTNSAGTGGTASHADFAIFDMKVRQGHAAQLEIADVKTQTAANTAISVMDTVIQNVNDQRASYGSYISRLEHASDNLTSIATNTAQSRSRVVDANYATETTELARTQIIQQAATAMLAQANQMKQTVLALLQ